MAGVIPRLSPRYLLVGGQAVGQFAVLLVMPLLTRAYPPEVLGYYQLALSLGVLLQSISTLRLESVIPAATDQDLRRLIRIGSLAQWLVAVIGLIAHLTLRALGDQRAADLAAMTAMVALAYGIAALDSSRLIRQASYTRLVVRNALGGTMSSAAQACVALLSGSVVMVAAGLLFGRLAAVAMTYARHERPPVATAGGVGPSGWGMRRGVLGVAGSLVATAGMQALVPLGSVLGSGGAAGLLGIGQRTATVPVSFLSQGLSQYAQATLAPAARERSSTLITLVRDEIRRLLPIALVAVLALSLLALPLAGPIFGSDWVEVGPIIAILAIPAGAQLVLSPISPIFIMIGAEGALLRAQSVRLVSVVVMTAGCHSLLPSTIGLALGFAIGSIFGYLWFYRTLVVVLSALGEDAV